MIKKIKNTILYAWEIPEAIILLPYMIYLIFKLLLNSDLTSIYLTSEEDIAKLIEDKMDLFYEKYYHYIQAFSFLFWALQLKIFYKIYLSYVSN